LDRGISARSTVKIRCDDRARHHRIRPRSSRDRRDRPPGGRSGIIPASELALLLAGHLPDRAHRADRKDVAGGLLVQTDDKTPGRRHLAQGRDQVAATTLDAELNDLKFAFRVDKHVKYKTISYDKDWRRSVSRGADEPGRFGAHRRARPPGWPPPTGSRRAPDRGSVVASDAFFIVRDGMWPASRAAPPRFVGYQPGGSIATDEVIKAPTRTASPWCSPA